MSYLSSKLAAVALLTAFCAAPVLAQTTPADTAKPTVKKTAPATGKAGTAKKPLTAQQQKKKACNAQAKKQSLKGDKRKTFVSACLKKDS